MNRPGFYSDSGLPWVWWSRLSGSHAAVVGWWRFSNSTGVSLGRVGGDDVTVEAVFELGGWDATVVFEQPAVVEPVDPFEGGELEVVETAPLLPTVTLLRNDAQPHRLRHQGRGVITTTTCPSSRSSSVPTARTRRRRGDGRGYPT